MTAQQIATLVIALIGALGHAGWITALAAHKRTAHRAAGGK